MLGGKQERYIPGLNKQNQVWKNRTPTEFKLIIIRLQIILMHALYH